MPQIEHIEVASGNVPPFASSSALKETRIYVVTKNTERIDAEWVLKYSLDALLELSMAMQGKLNVDFIPSSDGAVTTTRRIVSKGDTARAIDYTFNSAKGYSIG